MTTIVIHGPPGSCKTATAVWEYGVPALQAGRTVVTNIRGFTVERAKQIVPGIPDTAKTINIPLTPEGYHQAARFFHDAPLGALILLDEVQKIYPSSQRNASVYDMDIPRELPGTADGETIGTVQHAFDQHRHLNWDIVCTCPNINQVAGFIRDVLEVAYRQRPMGGVLPFMTNRIKRVKHQPVSNGFVQTYILGNETFKINPKVFECYQSTATGVIKDSEDKFSIKNQPKLLFTLGSILFVLLVVGYKLSGLSGDTGASQDVYKNGSPVSFKTTEARISSSMRNAPHGSDDSLSFRVSRLIEQLKYYVGYTTVNGRHVYYFEGDTVQATSNDLLALNVEIKAVTRDFMQLSYNGNTWLLSTPYDRYKRSEEKDTTRQTLNLARSSAEL